MEIKWVGCNENNYEKGGSVDPKTGIKHKPIAIVNHVAEGSLDSVVSWFNNSQAQASTNYIVGKNGEIYWFVKEGEDRPFANGYICNPKWNGFIKRNDGSIVNPNRYTISIEREGKTQDELTEDQYDALLWLHKKLIKDWDIPITRDNILGHSDIDSCTRPNCPGSHFPWDTLINDLLNWRTDEMKPVETFKEGTTGEIIASVLNIRNSPDINGTIIGQLSKGAVIELKWKKDEWIMISYNNNDGWIHASFVDVKEPKHIATFLEQWQYDIGHYAVDYLSNIEFTDINGKVRKLIDRPDIWQDEKKLSENVPNWLFFEMIKRLHEGMKK